MHSLTYSQPCCSRRPRFCGRPGGGRFSDGRGRSRKERQMSLKAVSCGAAVACAVLAVAGLHVPPHNGCPGARLLSLASASAGEKKDDKPALSGTWAKKDGEVKLEFADKG